MPNAFQEHLDKALDLHRAGKLDEAEPLYNALLSRKFDDPMLLYLLGDLYLQKGQNGLAMNLLHCSITMKPDLVEAWLDLGTAFRHEQFNDLAEAAWRKALEVEPNIIGFSNMATLYADSGKPDAALEWLDRALALDPNHLESLWNKSLALLAKGRWQEGWELYENRRRLRHWHARTFGDDWDGSPGKRVLIHGEQGVGDEIMFLSLLPEVIRRCKSVVLEVNERVERLAKLSFPDVEVYNAEQQMKEAGVKVDCQLPIGSLPKLFKRFRDEDFPGAAYLEPDPQEVENYRKALATLGPRPWIALTWHGGTKQTRVEDRSLPLHAMTPVMAGRTCVCAQYGPYAPIEAEPFDLPIIDEASRGADLASQAALFRAVDVVVTVQQTAVHIAGAVGTPCLALISDTAPWRYGTDGDSMPWYQSVRLFRKTAPGHDGWRAPMSALAQALEEVDDAYCLRHAG